ncbi:antirestriction protein ArdA, partial [Klebsiella pneumoniae]
MNSSVTVPAVYVGTYHQYNGGSIFGKWFDLTDFDDKDEFYDACRALHAAEDDPEFMFQDWEGIPSQFASESSVKWAFIEAFR